MCQAHCYKWGMQRRSHHKLYRLGPVCEALWEDRKGRNRLSPGKSAKFWKGWVSFWRIHRNLLVRSEEMRFEAEILIFTKHEKAWPVWPKLVSLSYCSTHNTLKRLLCSHQNKVLWHLTLPSPPLWKDFPPHLYANSCLYFTQLLFPKIPCAFPSLEFAPIVVPTWMPLYELILILLVCHTLAKSQRFLSYLAHLVLSFLWMPLTLSHQHCHIWLCTISAILICPCVVCPLKF